MNKNFFKKDTQMTNKHKPAMLSDAQLKIKPPFPTLEEICFGLFSLRSSRSGYCSVIAQLALNHLTLRLSPYQFSSVQFSHSVMSDSLRPRELQHTRHPCPSPTPGVQTHIHPVGDAIQPSHPLSSPSPPAPNPSQHQGLFQ